jgi:hypothetical protein
MNQYFLIIIAQNTGRFIVISVQTVQLFADSMQHIAGRLLIASVPSGVLL